MALPPLLLLQDIALTFGGTPLIESAELSVSPGERACLVGRNGSGKSTLLKIAAGLIEADRGKRFVQPGATVRYLAQEPDLSAYPTTLAYVEAGLGPGDDPYRARYLLEQLGLTGDEKTTDLSGGEARRAALAHVLAPEPDILLLDEPTNHLDLPVIEWLEGELKSLRSALVLISHDRRFLESLSQATIWLDRGRTRRMERSFAHFEEWRDQVLEQEEAEHHKLGRKLVAEADWLRYGVTARRKRNVRRLGNLHAMRQQYRERQRAVGTVSMSLAEAEQSGTLVVEAEGISKAYDRPIVTNLSLRVLRGDRLGIIGPNGAGKTTLIHEISGVIPVDSGRMLLAGQDITQLPMPKRARLGLARSFQITSVVPEFTALENTALAVQARSGSSFRFLWPAASEQALNGPALAALSMVGLDGRAHVPAGEMSHGEKRQLELAIALATEPRLLLLDEPLAGAGPEETERLIGILRRLKARYTIVLVEHDMQAVFALADRISVLVYGRVIATGASDTIRSNAEVRAAYLGEDDVPLAMAEAPC